VANFWTGVFLQQGVAINHHTNCDNGRLTVNASNSLALVPEFCAFNGAWMTDVMVRKNRSDAIFIRCTNVFVNSLFLNSIRMQSKLTHDEKIARLIFGSVYPLYVAKVTSKGRTIEELHKVITWLTGFDDNQIQTLIDEKVTFQTFFDRATINPNANLITGVICGYRVEEIANPLTQKARYLDKLVDELAKGRKMEKILRQ